MDALKRIGNCGIVPVVVLDRVEDAVPTAKALIEGGIDIMEITLRTKPALECIREVAKSFPEICLGAGTVIDIEQCRKAVDAGAKFIVSPGFNREVVEWCVKEGIAVTPGCVTPTEIMGALSLGVNVLKFFPADVYGGLPAMKALSGPFGGVKFIPTGGVGAGNLHEYSASPFIHAVGGSWVCSKQDILSGSFDRITSLSAEAVKTTLGFEMAHIGINCETADQSLELCKLFDSAFGTGVKEGSSSNFASPGLEIMKSMFLGDNGHIAMRTVNIERAIAALTKKGFEVDMETAKYNGDKFIAVYLKKRFGGFAVHLLQK